MNIIHKSLVSMVLLLTVNSHAEDGNNSLEKTEYKLTTSYYTANNNNAYDVNLRANNGDHTAWIGQYQDSTEFKQTRAGYEYKEDENKLRITWSAQAASRGFIGGSATAEVGGDTFAIAGIGRTNLRTYYNLNVDPNDALTAGIGSRAVNNLELSLFRVWDDRLNTRQQVTHGVIRYKPTSNQRITFDVSYKSGLSDESVYLRGYALSITYDYKKFFLRVAEDQNANFINENMEKFSAGIRF